MQRVGVIVGLALLAGLVMVGAASANFPCPGVIQVDDTLANTASEMRTWHFDPVAAGTLKLSTCSHEPVTSRVTLFELKFANNNIGLSKSSIADCDAASNFNGRVAKAVRVGKIYHGLMSIDDITGGTHLHFCVEGPVIFVQH